MANVFEEGQDYLRSMFTLPSAKVDTLTQSRQDKINTLTDSKKVMLAGFEDADTVKTTDGSTVRLQGANGGMYDAVETAHDGKPIDMYGGTGDYQKSPTAMTAQRQLVSKMVGKPENELTQQDFVDVANYQTVQMAADTINGPGVWQAPFGKGTDPVNLTGRYKDANGQMVNEPLNIEATIAGTQADKYGRSLGTLGTAEGIDVTTPAASDPTRNARPTLGVNANKSAPYVDLTSSFRQDLDKRDTGTSSVGTRAANTASGFAYRALEGLAQTADLIPEAIEYGYKNLTGNPKSNWSDVEGLYSKETGDKLQRALGYDSNYMTKLADNTKASILDAYNNGNYLGVLKALGDAVLTPEVTGESFGFLLSMLLPGTGAVKALRVGSGVAKEAEAVAAAKGISKAEALSEVEKGQELGYKMTKAVLNDIGQVNYAEQVARDSEAEYKQRYGEEMDGTRRTGAFLLGFVSGKLDSAASMAIIKGTDPLAQSIRAAWQTAPEAVQKSTAIALAKTAGLPVARVTGAMLEEGVTEGLQTTLENTAARYKTGQAELGDLLTNPDNLAEIGRDALIGAAGGSHFAGPSVVKDMLGKMQVKFADVPTAVEMPQEERTARQDIMDGITTRFEQSVLEGKQLSPADSMAMSALNRGGDENAKSVLRGEKPEVTKRLGADLDDVNAHEILTPLVADASDSKTTVEEMVTQLKTQFPGLFNDTVQSIAEGGISMRKSVDTLLDFEEEGQKKTTNKVARDVSDGARGFNTYFAAAMTALAAGNTQKVQEAFGKLESFYNKQAIKLQMFEGAEQTAMAQVRQMEQAIRTANPTWSEEEIAASARKAVSDKYVDIDFGNGSLFKLKIGQVVEKFSKSPEDQLMFTGGGYMVYNNIRRAVDAMSVLLNTATKMTNMTETVQQPSQPIVQPQQVQKAPLVQRVQEKVDAYLTDNDNNIEAVRKIVNKGVATNAVQQKMIEVANQYLDSKQSAADKLVIKVNMQLDKLADELMNEVGKVPDFNPMSPEQYDQAIMNEVQAEMDLNAMNESLEEIELTNELYENMVDLNDYEASGMLQDIDMETVDEMDYDVVNAELEIDGSTDYEFDAGFNRKYAPKAIFNAEIKALMAEQKELMDKVDYLNAVGTEEQQEINTKRLEEVNELLKNQYAYSEKWLGSKKLVNLFGTFGVHKLTDIVQVRNLTGLNIGKIELTPTLKTELTNLVQTPTLTSSGELTKAALDNSPYVTMLFDQSVKGKVEFDGNTALGIHAATTNFLVDSLSELGRQKTEEDVVEMFPFLHSIEDLIGEPDLYESVMEGGMMMKFAADNIGSKTMEYLGLTVGKDATMLGYKGISTGLGAIGVELAIARGMLKEKVVDYHGTKISMVVPTKVLYENVETLSKDSKLFNDKFNIEQDTSRGPVYSQPAADRVVKIHHQPYALPTQIQVEAIRNLESMQYEINEGYDVLQELFTSTNGTLDKQALLAQLGWQAVNKDTMSKSTQMSIEGANRAYENSVDSLLGVKKDAPMWFKWFITKGGRYNLDSTTLNPQTDKHLHRWLVTATNSKTTLNKSEVDSLFSEDEKSETAIAFAYGIAQAFDVSIDKVSQSEVIEFAKGMLVMSKENLMDYVKEEMQAAAEKGKIAYEHLGQVAVAIAAIDAYQNSTDKFDTSLVVEFDGLTNGFAFKVLQYPLANYKEWLPKIGVLASDVYPEAKSMNEVRGSKTLLDVYETIGQKFRPIKWDGSKQETRMLNSLVEGKNPVLNKRMLANVKMAALVLKDTGLLPTLDVTDGIVSKEVRNIMKNPTMIFNYGAGLLKIVDNLAVKFVQDNIDKVLTLDDSIIAQVFGGDPTAIKENLRTYPLVHRSNRGVYELLYNLYKVSYTVPVGQALKATFSGYIKLNTAVNEAFATMYDVFNRNVGNVAAEMNNNGLLNSNYSKAKLDVLPLAMLSPADSVKVIREMVQRGLAPMIDNPDSKGKQQKLVVFSRAVSGINALEKLNAGTKAFDTNIAVKRADGTTRYIPMITKVVGEPKAAGGVLMTHTKDGLVMGMAINENKFLGVHDAEVLGLGQMKAVKDYNKAWYETNKAYSDIEHLIQQLGVMMKSTSLTADDSVRIQGRIDELQTYADVIRSNRAELFNSSLRIGQMVGLDGSMYEVNGEHMSKSEVTEEATTVEDNLDVDIGVPTVGVDTQTEAEYALEQIQNELSYLLSSDGKAERIADVGVSGYNYEVVQAKADMKKALAEVNRDRANSGLAPLVNPEVKVNNKLSEALGKVNTELATILLDDKKDC